MNIQQAYQRFEQWPDRSDLPITSTGYWPVRDTWSIVAVAVVKDVGRLETATTDDDLRDALREWVALREQDPLPGCQCEMDFQLSRTASDILYDCLYPKIPGCGRVIQTQPPPSVFHEIWKRHYVHRTITVSPATARALLDMEPENVGVALECEQGCIEKFQAKIWNGTWTAHDPNPETTPRLTPLAREDAEGNPLGGIEFRASGAHRLQSICNAGKTVGFEFYGPPDAFAFVDQLVAAEVTA